MALPTVTFVRLTLAPLLTKNARPALSALSVASLPTTVTLAVIIGNDCLSTMVRPLLTVMVLPVPPEVLASKMAWRSEPAPLSLPLVTAKSAAPAATGDSAVPASRIAVRPPRQLRRRTAQT